MSKNDPLIKSPYIREPKRDCPECLERVKKGEKGKIINRIPRSTRMCKACRRAYENNAMRLGNGPRGEKKKPVLSKEERRTELRRLQGRRVLLPEERRKIREGAKNSLKEFMRWMEAHDRAKKERGAYLLSQIRARMAEREARGEENSEEQRGD